jgi:hypothetical protein
VTCLVEHLTFSSAHVNVQEDELTSGEASSGTHLDGILTTCVKRYEQGREVHRRLCRYPAESGGGEPQILENQSTSPA